jgi:hypothetical protein
VNGLDGGSGGSTATAGMREAPPSVAAGEPAVVGVAMGGWPLDGLRLPQPKFTLTPS